MKRTNQHAAVPTVPLTGRRSPSATPLASVLALQRGAGNRAVAGLLARDPKTAEKKETRVAIFPGIGEIPLEGFQLPANHPGSTGSARPAPKEVILSSKSGPHSQLLWRESLYGRPKDVELVLGTLRIKLKGALVTGYQLGGSGNEPVETWTLNADSIEFVTEDGAKTDAPPRSERIER
jgi:hypothetical protein